MRQLSRSGKPANEMMAEAEKYQAETSAAIGDYLETKFAENKDNAIGYGLFMQIADGMTVAEIDSMLAESPEWMKNSNIVKSYKKMAESLEKTAAGKMFTDFEITTSNGTKKEIVRLRRQRRLRLARFLCKLVRSLHARNAYAEKNL